MFVNSFLLVTQFPKGTVLAKKPVFHYNICMNHLSVTSLSREQSFLRLRGWLARAEAVLIGAGAGLSTAAGFVYAGDRFEANFGDFAQKYGFHNMYEGGFYPYETAEEYWAYWSRYIYINRYQNPPNDTYGLLRALVQEKDYFVLTTNVDHCFQKAGFDKTRLFYTQGDYGLLQCSLPCHGKTYDNEHIIRLMVEQEKNMRVPSHLLPKCPVCGRSMVPNLRADDSFVQDTGWQTAAERYRQFLADHRNSPILYLELGVGFNTPGIIKYPFWRYTLANPQARYICINKGEVLCPLEIAGQSVTIDGDIYEILHQLNG